MDGPMLRLLTCHITDEDLVAQRGEGTGCTPHPWRANPMSCALRLSCPELNPEVAAGSRKLRWAAPPGDCPALRSLLSPALSKWPLSQREIPIYTGGRRALRRGRRGFSQRLGSRKKCSGPCPRGLVMTLKTRAQESFTGINPEDVYPENCRPTQA